MHFFLNLTHVYGDEKYQVNQFWAIYIYFNLGRFIVTVDIISVLRCSMDNLFL